MKKRSNNLLKAVVLFILVLSVTSMTSYANSAAPKGIKHPVIQFDDQTGIELIAEELDVVVNKGYETSSFDARYFIRNSTQESIEREIWFFAPYGYGDSFKAFKNASELEAHEVEIESDAFEHNFEKRIYFVMPDGIEYPDIYRGGYIYHMESVFVEVFTLTMEPDETCELRFVYSSENGEIRIREFASNLKNQIYSLSPASYFEGDKEVKINLTLPMNSIMGSNIPFEQVTGNTYSWEGTIDEETDLYLTFGNQFLFLFEKKTLQVLSCIGLFLMIVINRKYISKPIIGVMSILGIAGMIFLLAYTELYFFAMIFFLTWPLVLIVLVVIISKTRYLEYKITLGALAILILITAFQMIRSS